MVCPMIVQFLPSGLSKLVCVTFELPKKTRTRGKQKSESCKEMPCIR